MAEVTILKNTRRQAVVSAVGTGTFFCNLTSILSTVRANSAANGEVLQTFDEPNAVCSITDVAFSINNNVTVSRGGTNYLTLTAGQADFEFSQKYGYVLNPDVTQHSNANIRIDFGASTGTVILGLSKGPGFNEPDLQILGDSQRP